MKAKHFPKNLARDTGYSECPWCMTPVSNLTECLNCFLNDLEAGKEIKTELEVLEFLEKNLVAYSYKADNKSRTSSRLRANTSSSGSATHTPNPTLNLGALPMAASSTRNRRVSAATKITSPVTEGTEEGGHGERVIRVKTPHFSSGAGATEFSEKSASVTPPEGSSNIGAGATKFVQQFTSTISVAQGPSIDYVTTGLAQSTLETSSAPQSGAGAASTKSKQSTPATLGTQHSSIRAVAAVFPEQSTTATASAHSSSIGAAATRPKQLTSATSSAPRSTSGAAAPVLKRSTTATTFNGQPVAKKRSVSRPEIRSPPHSTAKEHEPTALQSHWYEGASKDEKKPYFVEHEAVGSHRAAPIANMGQFQTPDPSLAE